MSSTTSKIIVEQPEERARGAGPPGSLLPSRWIEGLRTCVSRSWADDARADLPPRMAPSI